MPNNHPRETAPRQESLAEFAHTVSDSSDRLAVLLNEARARVSQRPDPGDPPDRPTSPDRASAVTRTTYPTGDQGGDPLMKSSYLTTDVSNRARKISLYQAFLGESPVSGAIEAIAARLVSGGWVLKPVDAKHPNEETREPLQELLDWCNPDEEFGQMLHDTATDLLWAGEAYWEITSKSSVYWGRKVPYELFTVDPISMDYVLAPNRKQIAGYVQQGEDGKPIPLKPSQIIRWWFPDPRNRFKALSPLEKLLNPVVTDTYLQLSDQKYFQQGNRSGTAILLKNGNQALASRLLRWITEQYLGVKNAHKPLILFGEQSDMDIRDVPDHSSIDVVERRKYSRDEILSGYKVPPHLMSALEGTGQGGQAVGDTMEKQFVHTAVDPIRQRIMSKATFRICVQGFGIDDWVIDTTYADLRDSDRVLENMKTRIFTGLSTINRELAEQKQPSIEGGDIPILVLGSTIVRVDSLPNLPMTPPAPGGAAGAGGDEDPTGSGFTGDPKDDPRDKQAAAQKPKTPADAKGTTGHPTGPDLSD
jgi:hypothetical protein